MTQNKVSAGRIACATRGGEGSEPTIARAIDLAKERKLELTFLYIVDLEFMKRTSVARTERAADELRKMGEFIMIGLVEKAESQGVDANYSVLHGHFKEELLRYVAENRPTTLVLGCPRPETCRVDLLRLTELGEEIRTETGVEVDIVTA